MLVVLSQNLCLTNDAYIYVQRPGKASQEQQFQYAILWQSPEHSAKGSGYGRRHTDVLCSL